MRLFSIVSTIALLAATADAMPSESRLHRRAAPASPVTRILCIPNRIMILNFHVD